MTIMYKLVSQAWKTHKDMEWKIGKTNRALGEGTEMCTDQVLHCYSDPRLAVIFNSIHANIPNPILLEFKCSPIVNNDGLKFACKVQTPIRQIKLPQISLTQKVAFAIKVALSVYKSDNFVEWAENWLSGRDRTADAADAAADAARAAAYAADAADAARAAARAAAYAADAARAAAYAAPNFKEIIEWVLENIS